MKAITEKLSRAKNAQDAKNAMNINMGSLSPFTGRGQGEGQLCSPRHPIRQPLTPTLSPQAGRGGLATGVFALTAIAAALLLAPLTVSAANECGDVAANGTAADSFTCAAGSYGGGITYGTSGNLTLTTGGAIDAGSTGFDFIKNRTNAINLNATAGTVGGTGGISIGFDPVDLAASANALGNVLANGAVTINAGNVIGGVDVDSVDGNVTVNSTGGDINIRRARPFDMIGSAPNGNINVTGAGDITIFRAGSGTTTTNSTGTGLTHIISSNTGRHNSNAGAVNATVGSGGLRLDITGVAPEGGRRQGGFGGDGLPDPNFSLSGIGPSSLNGVTAQGAGAAVVNVFRDEFYFGRLGLDVGSGLVHINEHYAKLQGTVNFANLAGGATVNVGAGGIWLLSSTPTQMSAADDLIHVGSGGFLSTTLGGSTSGLDTYTIDFGAGDNQLVNEGRLIVGLENISISTFIPLGEYGSVPRDQYEAELRLVNLQTFENHGEIWLGTALRVGDRYSPIVSNPDRFFYAQGTDRATDDILSLPGTTFVAGETGRVFMDVAFTVTPEQLAAGLSQDRCDSTVRGAGDSLPFADCINLQNGAIEGVIYINATDTTIGGRGSYNPDSTIVVVDLSDGAGGPGSGAGAAAGQVVFAPEMRFYNPAFGGVYDNGMFMSVLAYDEAAMQFKVATVPSGGAQHQPLIANAAQAGWRTATGSFFDRQADLRDTLRGGNVEKRGVWLRSTYDQGEREAQQNHSTTLADYQYDSTHDVNTSAVTVGVDFLQAGGEDRYWLVGGMLGYVRTDMEYARFYTDTAALNGMLLGAYASFVSGPLFVDATVSQIWNRLDQDMPQAELFRDSLLSTDITTLGFQAEAGWRFDVADRVRLEPLLMIAHATTDVDDFKVPEEDPILPGNQVSFEKTTSTRVGGGLRGSTEMAVFGDVKLGLSLTGRYQQELDGEAKARIGNLNPISPEVVDKFDGSFSELMGGVTLANATGRISGVLNVGSKFGDDYSALSGSFGFRYQW
jgi:hypothetical protein